MAKLEIRSLGRRAFAECLGCTIFIFIGTLQGLVGGVLVAAFAHGITIALLIMGMGHISGGHFNPAVTLGCLVGGAIHIVDAVAYMIAQLLGGFFGSLLARAVVTDSLFTALKAGVTIPAMAVGSGTLQLGWFQLILLEALLTFVLVNSVLNAAVDHEGNHLAPFAIGLSVFVDILAGGKLSGASMNPARTFGPAVTSSIFGISGGWVYHYVYWIGPLVGGAVAGLFYKLILGSSGRRWIAN